MIFARVLRLCVCLLLFAAPAFAAGIAPVTIAILDTPADGYSYYASMVNDRGEVVGNEWNGVYWSPEGTLTALPRLGDGYYVFPVDLNERGQVAGTATIGAAASDPRTQLFLWSPTQGMEEPGALPGGEGISVADMNNAGAIVGSGDDPWGPSAFGSSGFLWTREGGFEVLSLPANGLEGFPNAINDSGWIVGDYARGTDAYDLSYHGALWRPDGSFLEIGTPGEYWSAAMFVNNHGQVAGVFSMLGDGHVHPFVWSVAGGFVDCGQLVEGDFVDVTGFNELGHLVGYSYLGGPWFWSPETGVVAMGSLGGGTYGVPHAINNHDQAVGWSWAAGTAPGRQESHAFLWSPSTGIQDLGTLGGTGSEAIDISDRGRIAGFVETIDPSTGHRTGQPVIWTIPDLGPVVPDGDEDIIRRLIREVTALREADGLSQANAAKLLQALESALAFRDDGKHHQACHALDRFVEHVEHLVIKHQLAHDTGEGWVELAEKARQLMGEKHTRCAKEKSHR